MSGPIVNHETGEIIETLNHAEARRLTDRIKLLAETVADQVEKMAGLIDEARIGSAWLALGYASWTAYVSGEFAKVLPRLEREPRREFVRELAAQGMSTRAIAPVVGVHFDTVARDLAAGVVSTTPVTTVTPAAPVAPVRQSPVPSGGRITGLDGKTYTRPKATERDLSSFVDSDSTIQDSRFRAALTKALREVAAVHQFDAKRVATVADDLTMTAIEAAFDNFSHWRDQIKASRSGLRVIKGGAE